MDDLVLMTRRDRIAILTLNRPAKLNALNYAMNDRLRARLDAIEEEDDIRAVVLTGAGDRAFSAGGDIPEFAASVADGVDVAMRAFVRRGQATTRRIETFSKPIVAAVNGLAFGGGCEITEAAHLAMADERAVFAKPEIAIGIPPTFGGTQRLPRVAGRKRALELLLTGDRFSAERACEIGLVNAVVPAGAAVDAACALLERVLVHSPIAAARILAAVTRGLDVGMADGLEIEAEQFARMAPTADAREGMTAWTERRPPAYAGA